MKPPFDQSLIAKGGSLALLSVYHDRVVHHFNSSNSFPITIGMTCVYTVGGEGEIGRGGDRKGCELC
jgi:hypothetical protein